MRRCLKMLSTSESTILDKHKLNDIYKKYDQNNMKINEYP